MTVVYVALKCGRCNFAQVQQQKGGDASDLAVGVTAKCKVCGEKRSDFEVLSEGQKAKELRVLVQKENEKLCSSSGFTSAAALR